MTTIREAALVLASRCDGAKEEDGQGFNKPDQWVKDLLCYPLWTVEEEQQVILTMRKYGKQLSSYGIDFDALESSEAAYDAAMEGRMQIDARVREEKEAEKNKKVVDYKDGRFTFEFRYSEELKDALKQTVLGRGWNPDLKQWWAPSTSFESVELFAVAQGFQVTMEAQKVIDGSHMKSLMPFAFGDRTTHPSYTHTMTQPVNVEPKTPPKNIIVADGLFEIRFPFSDPIRLDLKQNVPGRAFDGNRKLWTAPLTSEMEVRAFAERHEFVLGKSVAKAAETRQVALKASKAIDSQFMEDFRSRSGFALRPYQRAGAEYLVKKERAILGDEMRTGKTSQVCGAAHHLFSTGKVKRMLVICPSNVIPVWKAHCIEWLPNLRYRIAPAPPDGAQVFITSYARAQKNRARLKAENWDIVVTDELHRLKNRNAARTKAIIGHGDRRDGTYESGIIERAKYRWMLSGTAVEKKPAELLQPLTGLGRLDDMGGFVSFATRYCGWEKGVQGSINGTVFSRLPELNQKLQETCFLRRLLSDVSDQMPQRTYIHVPLQMKNSRRYFTEQARIFERMDSETYSQVASAASLFTLRRIAAEEKVADAISWLENWLEENESRKLVLMGWHREPLEAIAQHFGDKSVLFIGGATQPEKVHRFQNDPTCRLFIGSILTAGEGIDLSAASDMAVYELPWNWSQLSQGLARTLKVGSLTSLGYYYLLAEDSIDVEIAELVEHKRKVSEGVLDGKVSTDDDAESVTQLLKKTKTKSQQEMMQ